MNILRWILAYLLGAVVWLFFPEVCGLLAPQSSTLTTGIYGFNWFIAAVLFFTPLVSIFVFILILPCNNRSSSIAGLATFLSICIVGTFAVSFAFLIGGGDFNPLAMLLIELAGTVLGGRLAYAMLCWKLDAFPE